ncbi:hypothetical protein FACS1894102_6930 [Spirochaetia bacterium]|nr:hypothetical protein FACS1894102_6930 [Spirochaetia bacterium]
MFFLTLITFIITGCPCDGTFYQILVVKNQSSCTVSVNTDKHKSSLLKIGDVYDMPGDSARIGDVKEFQDNIEIYIIKLNDDNEEIQEVSTLATTIPIGSLNITKTDEDIGWQGYGTVTFELIITNELLGLTEEKSDEDDDTEDSHEGDE